MNFYNAESKTHPKKPFGLTEPNFLDKKLNKNNKKSSNYKGSLSNRTHYLQSDNKINQFFNNKFSMEPPKSPSKIETNSPQKEA